MLNFSYWNGTKIFFGKGTLSNLGPQIRAFGRKVLLVTGGGSVKASGLYDKVIAELSSAGQTVFELSGIQSNPKLSEVYKGIELCKRERIESILAVGGGSVIDTAKAVAIGAVSERDVWDYYRTGPGGMPPIAAALPIGAVLTIAATGSEMNGNSVITNWETKEKLSVVGCDSIYPKFSILDPENTFTVPKAATVNGCADILAHSFEAYFSKTPETPLQDRILEGIMTTTIENSHRVIADPRDYDARANVMWCGTMALNYLAGLGKAQDWACHKIEHELSAIYDIAHGAGLAILFPNWMRYVQGEGAGVFARFAERVWGVSAAKIGAEAAALEGIERTREFFTGLGLPARLADVGIDASRLELMAEKAVRFGPLGGYKRLERADVLEILRMSL